jgi:transposase
VWFHLLTSLISRIAYQVMEASMAWRELAGRQWELKCRPSRKGGRRPSDDRLCHEGILWILWTGVPCSELQERYGSRSAVNRRLKWWAERGIEPIIPARNNNKVATHQDDRKMRRYKRGCGIERSNSRLQNFRRLTARHERSEKVFTALVNMACALVTLKRVWG